MIIKPHLLAIFPILALAACSGSDNSSSTPVANAAVVATAAPDYSSGAVSLVDSTTPFTAQNNLNATTSDISVRADGDHYFLIRRYGSDQISRYEASAPTTPVYTYSTNDSSGADSNPYDLIIASETKGYLIRYGSSTLWIVNPSATTEAAFKTGEIDLSQYAAGSDGIPQMSAGLIKNGKLYVALQRLESTDQFEANDDGYVAVIDTSTDTEIPTTSSTTTPAPTLKGIDLPVRDPLRLVSVPNSTAVLVVADGGYDGNFNPQYDGGIVSIDSSSSASAGYAATLLLDDGDATTHPYGQIEDMAIAASDRAYFVGSTGYSGAQSIYRFNPTAASPVTPIAVTNYQGLQLGPISADASGNLWLGQISSTAPGLTVLGFQGDAETVVAPLIDTVLNPLNIDFLVVPTSL